VDDSKCYFCATENEFIEPNQLPKWLKQTRTKKEQDCVPVIRYDPTATTEALWIKAERACRKGAEV
jgi:hypothetical protein